MTWVAAALMACLCLHQSALAADAVPYPRVHRMAGGESEVFANASIIEGERGVVVVDALLTRSGSARLRERVDAVGKPLLAVLLTHGHPDHYGRSTTLNDSGSRCKVSKAQTALTDGQINDIERSMIEYVGHHKMNRWILEGARAVAEELAVAGGP